MALQARAASLEDAKEQLRRNWNKWLAWANELLVHRPCDERQNACPSNSLTPGIAFGFRRNRS